MGNGSQNGEAGRSGAPPFVSLAAVALVALAAASFLVPGSAERLEYDRARIAAGETWRLLTCHFVHWTGEHLLWDAAAFGVLAGMCLRRSPRRTLATLAVASAAIPAAVWFALPGLPLYRGLSGLDSALYALLAVLVIREGMAQRRRAVALVGLAALAALAAKVGYEFASARAVFADSAGFVPVPLAHVAGAATGVLTGTLLQAARSVVTQPGSIRARPQDSRLGAGPVSRPGDGLRVAHVSGKRTRDATVCCMTKPKAPSRARTTVNLDRLEAATGRWRITTGAARNPLPRAVATDPGVAAAISAWMSAHKAHTKPDAAASAQLEQDIKANVTAALRALPPDAPASS